MRPLLIVAVLGTAFSVTSVMAQDGSSSSASHKKDHTPTLVDSLVENGPEQPGAREELLRNAAERKAKAAKAAADQEKASTDDASPAAKTPAPVIPTVQAVPPGPPQKNLTGAEFRQLHVGSTSKDVLNVLGPPSSRLVVPDDDGHLRETLEYFSKGASLGTVRLDNGRVTQIDTKSN
jgi:hypothetical protein